MLVVTDLSKLSKYGFTRALDEYSKEQQKNLCEGSISNLSRIYKKLIYETEVEISLLVNTYGNTDNNEICVAVFSEEGNHIIDETTELDLLFDMIKDGVVIKI